MNLLVIALCWSTAFSGGTICAPGKKCEVALRLKVPESVSLQASRRAAGDASAPPPILMLQGLEIGDNGFDIEVLSRPESSTSESEIVVGSSAIVGSIQSAEQATRRKIDLPLPLNDRALALLASRHEIQLILKIIPVGDLHDTITLDKVTFQIPKTSAD